MGRTYLSDREKELYPPLEGKLTEQHYNTEELTEELTNDEFNWHCGI